MLCPLISLGFGPRCHSSHPFSQSPTHRLTRYKLSQFDVLVRLGIISVFVLLTIAFVLPSFGPTVSSLNWPPSSDQIGKHFLGFFCNHGYIKLQLFPLNLLPRVDFRPQMALGTFSSKWAFDYCVRLRPMGCGTVVVMIKILRLEAISFSSAPPCSFSISLAPSPISPRMGLSKLMGLC